MSAQYPKLDHEEPLHIFAYKLKLILSYESLWTHLQLKKPRNAYQWLADEADLSSSYLYRLVKNEVNISIDRAGTIASALHLPLWQMLKPDYDFLAIIDGKKNT